MIFVKKYKTGAHDATTLLPPSLTLSSPPPSPCSDVCWRFYHHGRETEDI